MYIDDEMDKKKGIERLTDALATLKWEIWEQFAIASREDILPDEWEQESERRIREYPKLNYEYEKSCVLDK